MAEETDKKIKEKDIVGLKSRRSAATHRDGFVPKCSVRRREEDEMDAAYAL